MTTQHQSNDSTESGDHVNVNKTTEMTVQHPTIQQQSKEPTRFDNITKSPNDKRNYRGLILENKLKVLLISDPTTDKSAASLDVNVGNLSDPKEIPGLAHFCEHMLFLGTKKYPKVNDYNEFLSQHGGASNASTYADHTNYYFDVNPDKLEGALDRFSQFFISPLFTESATEKEITAVHLEHEKNLANDVWRANQLEKFTANPDHPFSYFGTGNRDTLDIIPKQKNIDVRQELIKFYNTWYSANIMSLSVFGKESLDDLENIVVKMFSDIENKDIEAPRWNDHPFSDEHFQTKWLFTPIKDARNLLITFPIPDLQEHYKAAPVHYWAHLLGHEGKGSLLSALKDKGWCNSLISGKKFAARGFDFFIVYVDLTKEGINHVDDIIMMMFQYINMLKEKGPLEWIYREYADISSMNFRFKEKSVPRNYVCETVKALQDYPFEEVLIVPHIYMEWNPELIKDVAQYLVPEKVRVHVMAKMFENVVDSVEPWYGTKFKKVKIPEDQINQWNNAGFNDAFTLPEKNEFVPTKFDIKQPIDKVEKFPTVIEDNPLIRVWFKQDDEFLIPKATMIFDFISTFAYMDPISTNMTNMFALLLKDSLNEYAYNADLAGLKWIISTSKYGLSLLVTGYDDKLNCLLEKILDRMFNFTIDEKRFEITKENYIRSLKNFETEQPYQHAVYYLAILLSEQSWTKAELLNACSMLTLERVQQFVPLLMSKTHIEYLAHGNLTKTEALNTAKIVETKMTSAVKELTPLLPKQLTLFRELQLPNGCHYLYEMENEHHKSSCTQIYYQTGMQSTESNMLLELFTQIISEPCFNILRTKEQLAYMVFGGILRSSSVQGLRIIVQSSKHPQFVEKRIDAFMESMKEYISTMSEEQFEKHKTSLASKRLEKPKTMNALADIFWNEIAMQQYNFDRANIEVAYLRTITLDQMINYYNEMVDSKSTKRHKLSVHVVSTAEGGEAENYKETTSTDGESDVPEPTRINDVLQFKTSHPLFPLMKPFNNMPRRGVRQQSKL